MNQQERVPGDEVAPEAAPDVPTEPDATPEPDAASEPGPEPDAAPRPDVVAEDAAVAGLADATRVRRAPRFGSFIFAAIILSVFLAGLFSFVRDSTLSPAVVAARALDSWGIFWLLLIAISAFLVLFSFGLAVWLDRRSVRKQQRAAERTGSRRG
ncbi:hypothetical protein C8046_14955 [Serinibacter arcticus]|uniref:Uncharacterized protein n=1 Tax=Serinibacter arcticus TaxID=1655435 RepID=A0A2U1ZXU2_9MICO|nr:hypothetical protein [Serinibacter arcticus]PWD51753.1 hypothetical protein C8046_14955 [Serinibacter arcticus]